MKLYFAGILSLSLLAHISGAQQVAYTLDDTLRGSVTPERAWWDVTHYDLSVTVNPERKFINGNVEITYHILNSNSTLQVDLQPPLIVDSVLQDGEKLTFSKAGNNAHMIRLKKSQVPGKSEAIRVYYQGNPKIAVNPPWDGGVQFVTDSAGNAFVATSCQGLGASVWWPNKDHSYDEPDSMTIRVTVPEKLMDVSNGRLQQVVENADDSRTFVWRVSNPINNYGVNMNIANYEHFADTLNGEGGLLDLNFYVLPENLAKAKEQFKQAKLMLRAFEYWFGPYPFYEDGYKLVETPYLGMEHQSSVTYGNGYKNGYLGRDLSGTGWGLKWDFIIIHESGHEWFANNITYRDIADMWIHESFTNYSESLFIEYYFGKEAATDYVVGTRKDIKNDIPLIGVYNVNQRGSGDMYPKGGNMLHTMRHALDDDQLFRKILRGLNTTFYHQTVTSAQIEEYITKTSGVDFSKVFDQYLRTTKIPVLELAKSKGGTSYRWKNVVSGFNMPLVIKTKSRKDRRLKPTADWQMIKKNLLPYKQYLERMYYIKVEIGVK